MRAMDAGNVAGDRSVSWAFGAVMLFMTLTGIFIVSTLIGVLNTAIGGLLENLRKGKSFVAESGHTVILGFTPKVHTLLRELATANENQRHSCVVILADRDKVAMDDDIRQQLPKTRMKVVTRSGDPLALPDLEILNLASTKSVIVLSPETDADGEPIPSADRDTAVVKTLLAITKASAEAKEPLHIVAELQDEKALAVARMVVGLDSALVLAPPLISRLLVQTGRQSGLSMVYTELLDFGGSEIYIQPEPALVGRTFHEVVHAYDDSAIMGLIAANEELLLPPPMNRPLAPGDQVIAISEDDDTVIVNSQFRGIDEALQVPARGRVEQPPERILVLGASESMSLVLRELDAYVAYGSQALVVGEDTAGAERVEQLRRILRNIGVGYHPGDITDRALLDQLRVHEYNHVLVLAETKGRDLQASDARTLYTLLNLRDIARRSGIKVPITTEMLDIRNRDLAAVAEADDFIVSNTLISLMMSQLSENRRLVRVFDDLFTPGGYEIYLKPAGEYIALGHEVDFYAVVESAARRGQVAIGYRLGALSKDASASFGVAVNPKKSNRLVFGPADKIIVLADN
jgi:hypothetical protein